MYVSRLRAKLPRRTAPIFSLACAIVSKRNATQDRPDLIQSELSGLAFSACQQLFKTAHLDTMFTQPAPPTVVNEELCMFIDPAAGGPQSDYAVLTVARRKGIITVGD